MKYGPMNEITAQFFHTLFIFDAVSILLSIAKFLQQETDNGEIYSSAFNWELFSTNQKLGMLRRLKTLKKTIQCIEFTIKR